LTGGINPSQYSVEHRIISIVPRCFKPKDAKAAFFIEKRDPLNQAGDVLDGSAAFWGCGGRLVSGVSL
jgi:hypothetical protein